MDASRHSDVLLQKLQTFHSKGFLCDTIVNVGHQSLKAHGVMLAAVSPFFKEALETNTEPGLHVINLTGCDFDVLEIAVRFIYTGKLEVTEKYAEPEKMDDLVNSLSDLGLDRDHLCRWDIFKCEEEEEKEVSRCKETSKLPMTVNTQEPVPDAATVKDKFISDSEIQTNRSPKTLGDRGADHSKLAKGLEAMKTEQDTKRFNNPLELSVVSNGWVLKGETGSRFLEVSSDILSDNLINDRENETFAINSDVSLRGEKKLSEKGNLSGRLTLSAPEMPDAFPTPSTDLLQAPISDFSENVSSHEDESCRLSEAKNKRLIPWKRPSIVCPVCNKVFARVDRFKIHQRIHTGELPYSCEYCGKKFAFGNNLSRHVKSHTGEKRFLCHFCGRAFIQKATLEDHIAVHTKERNHMCNFCGKFFKSAGCLRTHSRQHRHVPPRRRHETTVVGAESSQEASKLTKKNGATRFACQICQKDYANKTTLTIHIRQHSAASKPYKCTSCDKTFWQRAHREIHERSHSGVRPYSCTLCGKTFSYSAGLKLHTRLHTGEKPYNCEFCGSCYTQHAHLRSHIRTHTGEKPFECKVCGKKYRNKVDLRFHQKRNPSCVS